MSKVNIMEYDEQLEAAMIKSCMLMDRLDATGREIYFEKKLLAYIFKGDINSLDSAYSLLSKQQPEYSFGKDKTGKALRALAEKGFIIIDDNGNVSLSEHAASDGRLSAEKMSEDLDILVRDIYDSVRAVFPGRNDRNQIMNNIRQCIEYFVRVSCYKFLGVDDNISANNINKLKELASTKLVGKKSLVDQIILSIGNALDSPTLEQQATLEKMSRIIMTTRMSGIDPFLNSFKNSVIGFKTFVLDTDFVLYAITDNGETSRQYQILLKMLLQCGCQVYIPKEVLTEVYDHAEAAIKGYRFVNPVAGQKGMNWAVEDVDNLILKSYYLKKMEKSDASWFKYIRNYYDREAGESFTIDVVMGKLGKDKNLHYGKMPYDCNIFNSTKQEDVVMRDQLREKALAATLKTIKAEYRDDEKNQRVADTDTMLYLTVRKLNLEEKKRNGEVAERNDLLSHKYYLLTEFFRIYYCAREIKVYDKVLCTPTALMTYLVEAGIMNDKDLRIVSLFDNPFLAYIANESWDVAENLLKAGIDFADKSIVRLRYDLQDELHQLLTSKPGEDAYNKAYEEVEEKGYQFVDAMAYAKEMERKYRKSQEDLEEANKAIKEKDRQLAKKRYQDRINKLPKRKH